MTTTHVLETSEVDLAYDVHAPAHTTGEHPPLFMIGQPMDAGGFTTLASLLPERTVITYDPRGLGRSMRKDGLTDHTPTVQAGDVHTLIEVLGAGPVEVFATSADAAERARAGCVTSPTGRTSVVVAEMLGRRPTVFPSHHGGFMGGEFGYAGQPEVFARRLREVLDGAG